MATQTQRRATRRAPAKAIRRRIGIFLWHPGSDPELVESCNDYCEAEAIAEAEKAAPTGGQLLFSPPCLLK